MGTKSKEEPLCFEGDIPIYKDNRFTFNFNQTEMIKLAKIINQTGLSVPKIVAILAQPCCQCGNDNVVLTLPKNILSTKKGNNGGTLIKQK